MPWPHPLFKASPIRRSRGVESHSLGAVVGSFKSAVTREINLLRKTPGAKVWQSSYYDHLIRDAADLERIRRYIQLNPTGGRRP
jgi:REP element-mobilizing transposase RayT